MKRTFLFLIALLFVSSNVYALTAQEILKKASDQLFAIYFNKYEAYVIEYEVTDKDKIYSGKTIVNGDKFRLDTPEISFIFDGKNYYLNSVQDDYSGNYRLLNKDEDWFQITMLRGISNIAFIGVGGYIAIYPFSQNPYLSATVESTSQNQYVIKHAEEGTIDGRKVVVEFTVYIDKNSYLINEVKNGGSVEGDKSEDTIFKYFGYTKIQGTNHYYPSKTIMSNGQGKTEAIIKSFKIVSARDIKSQFIPTKIVTAQQQKVSKQAPKEKEVSKAVEEDKKSSKASNAVADELVSFNKEIAKEVKSDVRHNTKSIIKSGIKHKIGF